VLKEVFQAFQKIKAMATWLKSQLKKF
jgi:hypothetical protein